MFRPNVHICIYICKINVNKSIQTNKHKARYNIV